MLSLCVPKLWEIWRAYPVSCIEGTSPGNASG